MFGFRCFWFHSGPGKSIKFSFHVYEMLDFFPETEEKNLRLMVNLPVIVF